MTRATFFLLALLLPLAAVAESPKSHFKLQNEVAKGARKPAVDGALVLDPYLHLEFERGMISTSYSAYLKEGTYPLIMETDAGRFYLAPYRSFEYAKNGEIQVLIGGLFIRKSDNRAMVWHALGYSQEHWQEWRDGARIKKVKPGLLHVHNRPWVEPDFAVPENSFTLAEPDDR